MEETGLKHECGIFAAIGTPTWPNDTAELAQIICIGLEALQHRGQESCGIVTSDTTDDFHIQKGMGLVKHVFNTANLAPLRGSLGIGHTRYATAAAAAPINCQPFVVHSMHGALAVAHNGELVNCSALRRSVLSRGVGLSTHSDSELITQALCLIPPEGEVNGPDWPARIRHLMTLAPLSYSLVLMLSDRIYAVRDPFGNRPLCLGSLPGDAWLVSSESCALHTARHLRSVLPGEIVELTANGPRSISCSPAPRLAFCIFEYVYFARPNSQFEGQEVYTVRAQCGRQLAVEHPVAADVVGAVPESGNAAAFGFAAEARLPFAELLTKNTYVGRTFIQPTERLRQLNVALKFSPIAVNVRGRRVVLIDDSIVRGNTIGPIVRLLRRAGASEVHVRVASPPLRFPCYMGINIPTRGELIANGLDSKRLAEKVGADSVEYLSVEGLVKAVQLNLEPKAEKGHCTACLTGDYPGGVPTELDW